MAPLYFICFVHDDRCCALVCLFYDYFLVWSQFSKRFTLFERQVISWLNSKVTSATSAEKLNRNLSARWHATTTDEQRATKSSSNKIKLKQLEQRPNVTRGKKTNNPDLIKNQPRPEKENRTENVLVLATELTNKIKKVEEMMKALQNKESESYPCVFNDSSVKGREKEKRKIRNEKKHSRRSNRRRDTNRINTQFNQRYIKNLSNCKMTTDQINLLSKGLNFIQTPVLEENRIRQQLLLDFKQFATPVPVSGTVDKDTRPGRSRVSRLSLFCISLLCPQ